MVTLELSEEQAELERKLNLEVKELTEKLHQFAQLQLTRLNVDEGVISASLNR